MLRGGRLHLRISSPGRALALLAVAACGGSSPSGPREDPLVASVRAGIAEQLGLPAERVLCEPTRCEVDVGGLTLAVALEGEREVAWRTDEVVVTGPLVAHLRATLDELGVEAAVDCGPPVQPVPADGRLVCKVGEGGLAWIDLAAEGFEVEVALTPEAVAARTEPPDEERLEMLSRKLDRPDFDLDAGPEATEESGTPSSTVSGDAGEGGR